MRALILGCGYIGQALGERLSAEGHEVVGVRRRVDAAEATGAEAKAIQWVEADISQPGDLSKLPAGCDWVINTMASRPGGTVEDYEETYYQGTAKILDWLGDAPPQKYVYTSSTGVYGQQDGSVVKEEHPTAPTAATAQVLVRTEQLLLAAARERSLPAVILRVAGIYGPGRGYLLQRYLKNQATIPGDGRRYINMIHRVDVVGAIVAALTSGRPGEVYNAVDNEPVPYIHFYRWLAETLGKWMPHSEPEDLGENRKRGITNKRVSNRRLTMELGYSFTYPTFRQGYTAEIKALGDAGELDIEPEPR